MKTTPQAQHASTGAEEPSLSSVLPLEIPNDEPASERAAEGCLQLVREVLETLLLALALYFVLNLLTARVQVKGLSMYPTFQGGEAVLVNRLAYRWNPPQRGDVVVFHPQRFPNEEYIKRIIALPGEEVLIRNGTVYVNGVRLYEPYIAEPPRYQGRWVVPEGYIFVLGDNRNHSQDSHVFGPVPLEQVVGRAIFVYWPPHAWGTIKRPNFAPAGAAVEGSVR